MTDFDVVIVGGGAAGLSAALVLGRARREVLVVDAGAQSNRAAPHVGGLFGHDGTPPDVLYRLGREQLAAYPSVTLVDGEVDGGEVVDGGFRLTLRDAPDVVARRVLLATGMRYAFPDLPGIAHLWGDTVFHCPFCHGWEVRDRPVAVLGRDEQAVHRALLLRAWSPDVVLLTNGPADLGSEARDRLAAVGVPVEERRIVRLVDCSAHGACGRHLDGVELDDGTVLARAGLLVAAPLEQRSPLAARLGATFTERGTIEVDGFGATQVPGLYAAGDVAAPIQQVSVAVAGGALAAAGIMQDLVARGLALAGGPGAGAAPEALTPASPR